MRRSKNFLATPLCPLHPKSESGVRPGPASKLCPMCVWNTVCMESHQSVVQQSNLCDLLKSSANHMQTSPSSVDLLDTVLSLHLSQRLQDSFQKVEGFRYLELFKHVSINLPFLLQHPKRMAVQTAWKRSFPLTWPRSRRQVTGKGNM